FVFYQNPVPAAGVILLQNHNVLLTKRKYEPRANKWSLPAGFMEYGETVKETAVRELKEETNLDVKLTRLFGVYTGCDDPRNQAVLIVYEGEIVGGELRPGDDASEAKFFPLTDLPEDIAFEAHRRVLEELKAKVILEQNKE
ncbi:MAG TPA: NUDIX hydrolase, partial [Bacteroidetes bacterium]|nr:NUDIX hydrolase [Bacteroidota bacterium]